MMSERVGDSLSGRLFCFRKSKSEEASGEQKLACAIPSAEAFRAKLKERFLSMFCKGSARRMQSRARSSYAEPQPSLAVHLNALQRYYNNLAPPNIAPRGVQISVKESATCR